MGIPICWTEILRWVFPSLTRHFTAYCSHWHMKLVSESPTKLMKLSSISLIAAALAAIAATAAPTPRPFERDVDIYSRATHKELAESHEQAINLCWDAAKGYRGHPNLPQDFAQMIKLNDEYKTKNEAHVKAGTVSHELLQESARIADRSKELATKGIRQTQLHTNQIKADNAPRTRSRPRWRMKEGEGGWYENISWAPVLDVTIHAI